jgi:hypothetical protein
MGITRPWTKRTQLPPDPAFRCRCPSHLVRMSFRSRGHSRTRSRPTYNHHPTRSYRRIPGRLNFRLRIRLSAVGDNSEERTLAGLRQASALVSLCAARRPRAARPAGTQDTGVIELALLQTTTTRTQPLFDNTRSS